MPTVFNPGGGAEPSPLAVFNLGATEAVTISAGSANESASIGADLARVVTNVPAHIQFGATPSASAGDALILPGHEYLFDITKNHKASLAIANEAVTDPRFYAPHDSQSLSAGAAAKTTTSLGSRTVWIAADVGLHYEVSRSPSVTSADTFLPANAGMVISVEPNRDKISVIAEGTGSGIAVISELMPRPGKAWITAMA